MSGFISKESIDEVTNKTDIIQVIGEYVPLTQRGADFMGCCPFHNEKTPSFHVSADKKVYHCFGCGAGGTVINFIMEMEKLTFPGAIEFLAKRAGVQLHYTDSGSQTQKEDPDAKLKGEMIDLYNRTAALFHYMLTQTEQGEFALKYITERGLTKETLEKFKIGYSPADRKWLKSFLLKKNYSADFLSKSGLFSRNYPDFAFFSDRLMFPIFDRRGDVVAMGGRFLRGDASKSPKYLNSGDLIQYKKGNTLYAFNFAKNSIRENRKVIFCEGYMDCVAYHQCGVTYAVAPLGTSLTDEQIMLVKPFVDTVLLSFDSDGAGQKATRRAMLMLRKHSITVKIIRLTGGKDPAEIMLKFGADVLTNEINNAILDNDYLLSKLKETYPVETPEGKAKASIEFFEYIDALQSDVQKEACLEQLSQTYGIDLEAARKDFTNREQLSRRINRNAESSQKTQRQQQKVKLSAELRAVLTAVTDDPVHFRKMSCELSVDDFDDIQAKKLFTIMDECEKSGNFSVSSILNRCDADVLKELILQSVTEYSEHIEQSVKDSILLVKRNSLEKKGREILGQMRSLEHSSAPEDRRKLTELLSMKVDIDKQIALLKG
ncbi:MAG TPA: DNA primase [Treponema sp.]|jgi:DNA primase|nr:DNA primase [Treponema sp.]HBB43151.1 DNA primase [Treponema sp.]